MKVSARKRRNLKMAVRMGRIHEASMKAPPQKRREMFREVLLLHLFSHPSMKALSNRKGNASDSGSLTQNQSPQ